MSLAIRNWPASDLMRFRNSPLTVCDSNTRMSLLNYPDEMPLAKWKLKMKDSYPRQHSLSAQLQRRIEDRHNMNRVMSLEKTTQGRDNKRWDLRGDQILRQDWLRQQREWERQQAQSAPQTTVQIEDEDMEDAVKPHKLSHDYPVEDGFLQEEREVEALISLLDENKRHPPDKSMENKADHEYDFDDEEYDRLLAELASDGEGSAQASLEATVSVDPQSQDVDMLLD